MTKLPLALLLATVAVWWASWLPAALAHEPPPHDMDLGVYPWQVAAWHHQCPSVVLQGMIYNGDCWTYTILPIRNTKTQCEQADMSRDGIVNMKDWIVFSRDFNTYYGKVCGEVDTDD